METNSGRNLLVVVKDTRIAPAVLQAETEWLNKILNEVESANNLAFCCEVLNLNKYRVETRYETVRKAILQREVKPFVFLFNKN